MGAHSYSDFLAAKAIVDPPTGLSLFGDMPACMKDHQAAITPWTLRRGRAALFAGTGLGKTLMELVWADEVAKATGRRVLHLAPLAVTAQILREAEKFQIAAGHVVNYQRLEKIDLSSFGGVILDESSILKSFDGHYRTLLIRECAQIPFRLAATATPAPNDLMEIGNHAEFLGIMSVTDMLATFFVHDGGDVRKWRLKGHAEDAFWRWVASWAVMLRKPSDLGFSDEGYDLPPLQMHEHKVEVPFAPGLHSGLLFPMEAITLQERLAARRESTPRRIGKAIEIVLRNNADRLEEWLGNLNMPPIGGGNIRTTPPSASGGEPRGATPTPTPNICEIITSPTPTSSGEPPSRRSGVTPPDASAMQATPIIGSGKSSTPQPLPPNGGEQAGCDQITGSSPRISTGYSPSKVADALFAANPEGIAARLCASITATRQALSGVSFATDAITASDTSRMILPGLSEPWLIWCNLNDEQDRLAKVFGSTCFSVTGSMTDVEKERQILAWINGERPIMISKPLIMGFGLNFQHCRNTIFVGLNDSFEQYYQAIRRFWRFGQTQPVNCHVIAAETEGATVANIRRKEAEADRMAEAMVRHMADLSAAEVRGTVRDTATYQPAAPVQVPSWLEAA